MTGPADDLVTGPSGTLATGLSTGGVVVVGSANTDLVLGVAAHPVPGRTVLAGTVSRSAGGKGLNQAVAAARDGAPTTFLGAVGDEAEGRQLVDLLHEEGVGTGLVRTVPAPTGLAVVVVDTAGENSIVVAQGANATFDALSVPDLAVVRSASVLLLQLEIPLATVVGAATAARAAGVRVVLNAAPARHLPKELLDAVDVLVVNEDEARSVGGDRAMSLGQLLASLVALVPDVVVTLGAAGCRHACRTGAGHTVPAPRVRAVDTTGAGDTFAGVLSAALARGLSMPDALRRAVVAGAVSVERPGAVPSIPHADETSARMESLDAARPT